MTIDQLGRDSIEREVRRLAPWYYRLDLRGVSTDITPACDRYGHRTIGPWGRGIVENRTVLDVACNEGAWSFAALDQGAAHTVGFDGRPINIEKARFVARVLGYDRAAFHVGTVADWPHDEYDVVLMCGILYHLAEPWRDIARYAAMARESVWVTSIVGGAAGRGYAPGPERESISASIHPGVDSMIPNNAATIVAEFAKHGFTPVRTDEHVWGPRGEAGCALLLRR